MGAGDCIDTTSSTNMYRAINLNDSYRREELKKVILENKLTHMIPRIQNDKSEYGTALAESDILIGYMKIKEHIVDVINQFSTSIVRATKELDKSKDRYGEIPEYLMAHEFGQLEYLLVSTIIETINNDVSIRELPTRREYEKLRRTARDVVKEALHTNNIHGTMNKFFECAFPIIFRLYIRAHVYMCCGTKKYNNRHVIKNYMREGSGGIMMGLAYTNGDDHLCINTTYTDANQVYGVKDIFITKKSKYYKEDEIRGLYHFNCNGGSGCGCEILRYETGYINEILYDNNIKDRYFKYISMLCEKAKPTRDKKGLPPIKLIKYEFFHKTKPKDKLT